ncbi:MAG: GntR family transcriptional regulator [Lachnospiraceae bacterium]|nr:GntR family transcriptional regulator [Lachnospiraceae bacterium]MCI8825979.1 GntR family transcriptional regulator [Lachnospiraceae bacterium]MCI9370577.1 GntR family transcriptional regulator [Lachnospiraceae bacterium]MDE7308629.1 GntR family transcriptional regulator [Lachnospiraceae bacterium]
MFQIDTMSRMPIYEQVVNQLEYFVLNGILKEGEQIPSVRNLSVDLSINPNTIQKAYFELDKRGIIQSVPGRGCFVTDSAKDILSAKKREQLADLKILVNELALAEVRKEEVISCIEEVYDNLQPVKI